MSKCTLYFMSFYSYFPVDLVTCMGEQEIKTPGKSRRVGIDTVLVNFILGGNHQWTSIPSRRSRNTPSCFMLQKPQYFPIQIYAWHCIAFYCVASFTRHLGVAGLISHLAPMQALSLFYQLVCPQKDCVVHVHN